MIAQVDSSSATRNALGPAGVRAFQDAVEVAVCRARSH
jgi:hypothetical protein